MQTGIDSQEDYASEIPPIVCNHPDDVAEAHDLGGYRIQVRFNDGTSGVVDLSRRMATRRDGVFAALRDPAVFAAVGVVYGAVTWPGEIDLAPDAMYLALKQHGEWILD